MLNKLRIQVYSMIKNWGSKGQDQKSFVNPFTGETADKYSNPYKFSKNKRFSLEQPQKNTDPQESATVEFFKICGTVIKSDFKTVFLNARRVSVDAVRKKKENKEIQERFIELAYGKR